MKITISEGNKTVSIDTDQINETNPEVKTKVIIKKVPFVNNGRARHFKRWTIEEKGELLRLIGEGWSIERMAQQLGRKKTAIRQAMELRKTKPEWFKKA
jgi:hypothetical protein